jgi:hypothetical protein
LDPEGSASVSVRVDDAWDPLLVRVGSGRWGGSLPVDAGWALWRCLGEALRSTGEPPAWLSRVVEVAMPPSHWGWHRLVALLGCAVGCLPRGGRG